MVIISLELTRVNPDRNIFSITSTFLSPSLNFKLEFQIVEYDFRIVS